MSELDPQVEKSVTLLNRIPGITTVSSCYGHWEHDAYIAFCCLDWELLKKLINKICSITFSLKSDPSLRIHPWAVSVSGRDWEDKSLYWMVSVDRAFYKDCNLDDLWKALEEALKGEGKAKEEIVKYS